MCDIIKAEQCSVLNMQRYARGHIKIAMPPPCSPDVFLFLSPVSSLFLTMLVFTSLCCLSLFCAISGKMWEKNQCWSSTVNLCLFDIICWYSSILQITNVTQGALQSVQHMTFPVPRSSNLMKTSPIKLWTNKKEENPNTPFTYIHQKKGNEHKEESMNWDRSAGLWDIGNQHPEPKHLELGTNSQGERKGSQGWLMVPSKRTWVKRAQGRGNKESEEEERELHAPNNNWACFYSISTNATGWMN